ncbi:MAG: ParB/RepB/Spo0J family partition protein [Pseudomonadota bacterium]|nr:ParB/RepB/Spo0J family partition protein [Pseudomonadota bacterium]
MATATKMTKRETAMDFLGGLDDVTSAPPQYVPASSLAPDPDQPRQTFAQEAMDNLVAGIKSDGVLQPLLVRESGGNPPYIITDGERRWRAAQILKLDELPVLVRNDIDAKRLRFVQVMANANRENLTDIELATVIQQQLDENPKLKQKDMARQLGLSAATVTRLLAMLEPEYADLAKSGLIESASALAQLKTLDDASRAQLIEAAQHGQAITREAVDNRKAEIAAEAAVLAGAVVAQGQTNDEVSAVGADSTQDGNTDATGDNAGDPPDFDGAAASETTVATPREKPDGSGKAPAAATVKITLKIEDVELLIPYFVDKEAEKLDVKMSRDTAVGLLEKLGQPVPPELADFPQAIKDGIQALLTP